MWIPIAALAVGAVVVLALLGRPRHLVRGPVRWRAVGVAAVVAAVVVDLVELPGGAAGRLVAAALAVAFLLANLHLRGAALAVAGLLVGALPVAVNGAVTVPDRVATAIGRADDLGPARRIERADDDLKALSASVPLPGVDRAVRFADLVAAIGLVDAATYALTVRRARRRVRAAPVHPSARYATVALATALDLEGAARLGNGAPPHPHAHRRPLPVGAS